MAKTQEVRVTPAMLQASDPTLPSPFIRWIPDGNRMRVQTATRVQMAAGRVVRWLDAEEHSRPLTREEAAVLLFQQPSAIEEDGERARLEAQAEARAQEWWDAQAEQRRLDNERLTGFTREIAERAAAESARRLDTAACGIERCDNPQPCTDEQEARCEWSIGVAAMTMTAAQRFANRAAGCPRKAAHIQRLRQETNLEVLAARGRAARIPAEYLDAFAAPDYKPQLRPAYRAARDFTANRAQQFLVLLGTNQCGKTFAACRWLWNQENGLFVSHYDLDLAMRPGDETGLERRSHNAAALVLDNVESSLSEALRRRIEGLIVRFKQEGRRMVITSSMGQAEFMAAMKPAGAETGPAFARLTNGIAQGAVSMVECPSW